MSTHLGPTSEQAPQAIVPVRPATGPETAPASRHPRWPAPAHPRRQVAVAAHPPRLQGSVAAHPRRQDPVAAHPRRRLAVAAHPWPKPPSCGASWASRPGAPRPQPLQVIVHTQNRRGPGLMARPPPAPEGVSAMTIQATTGSRPAPQIQFPRLGSWVELHQEPCRGGRVYRLLVNHRTGQAIGLTGAEADLCRRLQAGAHLEEPGQAASAFLQELAEEGFLASNPPPAQPGRSITASAAALDVHWNGAGRLVRAAHDRGARHLFHPLAVAAQILLAAAGLVAVAAAFALPPGRAPAGPPGPDPRRDRPGPGRRRGPRVRPRPGRGPLPAAGGRRRDPAAPRHPRLLRRRPPGRCCSPATSA